MMNSMMVGVVFIALLAALRPRNDLTALMLGVAYALGIWAPMRYVLLL